MRNNQPSAGGLLGKVCKCTSPKRAALEWCLKTMAQHFLRGDFETIPAEIGVTEVHLPAP